MVLTSSILRYLLRADWADGRERTDEKGVIDLS